MQERLGRKGSLLHCWGKYAVSGHFEKLFPKQKQVLPQALDISALGQ